MTDYSATLIKLMSAIKIYRQLILKCKFDAAADVAVEMQLLANELQAWTEEQCTEIQNY
jgi:hypothetical protein